MRARPIVAALVVCGALGLAAQRLAPDGPGREPPGPPRSATAGTVPAAPATETSATTAEAATTKAVAARPGGPTGGRWVPLGDGLSTRCGDEAGLRLYLVEGEREPVGLLDDSCGPSS